MFGNKKMYKKGMEDALGANEGFSQKQQEALEALRRQVKEGQVTIEEGLSKLGDDIHGIYQYLTAKEKAALYHLNTPGDIKKMGENERQLLVAVLCQLANDEGPNVTELQQTYLRGVQRYVDVTTPQAALDDMSVVGEIDSVADQRAILQTVLEFLYLQDGYEFSDSQLKLLNDFSVNQNQSDAIENNVSLLYNALGAQGLAEKYGNDEVIQQAKDQAEAALQDFEKKISSNWFHVGVTHLCMIDYHHGTRSKLACLDSESYKDQSKCRSDAQREVDRYHRDVEKKMTSYMKRYGEDSMYKSLSDALESTLKARKKDLANLRSPKTAAVLGEIEQCLTKAKVVDKAALICDKLAEKYHLPDSSSYHSQIEYETYDPSSEDDNLLAKLIAKGYTRYGYHISSAVDAIREEGTEKLEDFVDDLTGQFNDLIDRCIVDPIQELLPKLREALDGEAADND